MTSLVFCCLGIRLVLFHVTFLHLTYNLKVFAAGLMWNLCSCNTQQEPNTTILTHIKFLLRSMQKVSKAAGFDYGFAVQGVLQSLVLFNSTLFVLRDSLHTDVLWDKVTIDSVTGTR